MSSLRSEIHIQTHLPTASGDPPKQLPPHAELNVSVKHAPDQAQMLGNLADAMDETRASLNAVLSSWKDWAGKEPDSTTGPQVNGKGGIRKDDGLQDDDDEDEDDEDEEEEE